MKYARFVLLVLFVALGSTSAAQAQERGRGGGDDDAQVILRDGDRRSRGETGSSRDQSVDRSRGRTGEIERERAEGRTGDVLSRRGDDHRDRGREQRKARDDRYDRDDRDRRYGDWEWVNRRRRGDVYGGIAPRIAGPPFCQNGEGQPVQGRAWCLEKGFGLRGYNDRYDDYEDRNRKRRRPIRNIIDLDGDAWRDLFYRRK